ncbi:DMT family transporter [Pseudoalteromonas spongiae]|uniref:DMT family transporter n=1 Tax=Pseudoalteromonas spongiae TaxID=298657 RepID=UPI000C2D679D|nr:DMT family transporter [Pseudoalteromonas spongiae]
MQNFKYHFLSILVTALVAASFISTAKLSGVINAFSLTLLRLSIAVIVLLPFILMKKYRITLTKKVLAKGFVMGLFFAVFFICMFKALETTTPLNTATLYTLVPFLTAIFSVFVFKESMSFKLLLIYLIGALGTCWVVVRGSLEVLIGMSINQGDYLFFLGCISMVCFSISMKLFNRYESSFVVVFFTLLGGAVWMLFALIIFEQPLGWFAIDINLSLHMLYLAVFATLISTFLIHKVTIKLGPTKVMAYIYLSPVFVAAFMWLFEGKNIPINVYPGMALSIIATLILQTTNKETSKT